MASSIETSMVKQFSSNIYHLSQQKDSRVWSLFNRKETLNSEEAYFDRLGAINDVQEKVGRNSDVQFSDVPYTRRRLTMSDYYWATLVDKEDKLRLIHSPESEFAIAARSQMARKMDDIGIAALLGTVYSGKAGATAVTLPDTQKIAAVSGGAHSQFNIETLRHLKYKFDVNEVEDMNRHILLGAAEIRALLQEDEMTSSDYAAVKALVHGEINTFMGFNFHRIERLPFTTASTTIDYATGAVGSGAGTAASGSKRCIAFAGSAMIAGIGANPTAKLSERADKHYANQLYYSMSIGAMRMEEEKVIEILVKQS
jgi:hypothetical protein